MIEMHRNHKEKDLLDVAQDIFEFNLEKSDEWTEDDELMDFYCNASRLDALFIFKFEDVIKFPKQKIKKLAIEGIEKLRRFELNE